MAIRNSIFIRARLIVLEKTILDIVDKAYSRHVLAFGGQASYDKVLATIRTGIELKYLSAIKFTGEKGKEIRNALEIRIDWEKHKALCTSGDGSVDFEVDGNKSIAEQVSAALALISRFIDEQLRRDQIDQIALTYSIRHEANRKEAFKALHLSEISDEEWSEWRKFQNSIRVDITPARLPELSLTFQSRREGD